MKCMQKKKNWQAKEKENQEIRHKWPRREKQNQEIRHKWPRKERELNELLKLKIRVAYTCIIVSLDTLKCEQYV